MGCVIKHSAATSDSGAVAPRSRSKRYSTHTPSRPSTEVDRRNAVNENPNGAVNNAPHANCGNNGMLCQKVSCRRPVSTKLCTGTEYAQSSLSATSARGSISNSSASQHSDKSA